MEKLKSLFAAASAVALGTVATSAFALDTTAVETAMSDGASTVQTVVGGLIGIVAVLVGVGIVMSLMKRS
jgi:hypothetical protein